MPTGDSNSDLRSTVAISPEDKFTQTVFQSSVLFCVVSRKRLIIDVAPGASVQLVQV